MKILTLGADDIDRVLEASDLFDHPADPAAAARFLSAGGHHLLVAYEESRPVGFVSGVETIHPDKGTEMLLYELAVHEDFRRRGIGRALVDALAGLARQRGCYGMWVLTDDDNVAARATYRAGGGSDDGRHLMISWTF